jgi:hypothetical protein
MTYRLLILLLILSLVNLGCYSAGMITRSEINQGYSGQIRLLNKDKTVYQFKEGNYKAENDSLYGKGNRVAGDNSVSEFHGKIAFSDIEMITGEKIDGGKTALLLLGIGSVVVLIYLLVSFNNSLHDLFL